MDAEIMDVGQELRKLADEDDAGGTTHPKENGSGGGGVGVGRAAAVPHAAAQHNTPGPPPSRSPGGGKRRILTHVTSGATSGVAPDAAAPAKPSEMLLAGPNPAESLRRALLRNDAGILQDQAVLRAIGDAVGARLADDGSRWSQQDRAALSNISLLVGDAMRRPVGSVSASASMSASAVAGSASTSNVVAPAAAVQQPSLPTIASNNTETTGNRKRKRQTRAETETEMLAVDACSTLPSSVTTGAANANANASADIRVRDALPLAAGGGGGGAASEPPSASSAATDTNTGLSDTKPPLTAFDRWLEKLKKFKEQYGDLEVPASGETKDLNKWLCRMKRACAAGGRRGTRYTITSQEAEALRDLGVHLSGIEFLPKEGRGRTLVTSESRLWELRQFKKQHGHLKVPASGETVSLYQWLRKKKRAFAAGRRHGDRTITIQETEALRDLGVHLSGIESLPKEGRGRTPFTFEGRLCELRQFKEQHGHLEVPASGETISLYHWFCGKKRAFAAGGRYGDRIITLQEIEALGELGALDEQKPVQRPVQKPDDNRAKIARALLFEAERVPMSSLPGRRARKIPKPRDDDRRALVARALLTGTEETPIASLSVARGTKRKLPMRQQEESQQQEKEDEEVGGGVATPAAVAAVQEQGEGDDHSNLFKALDEELEQLTDKEEEVEGDDDDGGDYYRHAPGALV